MKIQQTIPQATAKLSVDRVSASSLTAANFLEHYLRPGRPVVITGLFEPGTDWSLDSLSQKLDSFQLPVRRYGRQRYEQDKRTWHQIGSGVEAESLPFSQYVELLKSGEAYEQDIYLVKRFLGDTPLGDLSEFNSVSEHLGLKSPAGNFNLWLGTKDHTTCLHYDPMDGTLIQLHGRKRVVLFPPSQLHTLYPFPVSVHLRHGLNLRASYSQVYPDRPDFEAFPKLRQALRHRHDIVLDAGEVLFIPAGWWHELTTLDDFVCSVNRFWHVFPLHRALSWSKWRIHLGSVCALPHTVAKLLMTRGSSQGSFSLRELVQRI